MDGGAALKPNGLPDAAYVSVSLLAVGLVGLVKVGCVKLDDVFSRTVPYVCDVELKAGIAADMRADENPVDPNGRLVIDGAEDEEQTLALGIVANGASVISRTLAFVSDARQGRRPAEGNGDRFIVFRLAKGEFPCAVKIHPSVADAVGRGVQRFWNGLHCIAPFEKGDRDLF